MLSAFKYQVGDLLIGFNYGFRECGMLYKTAEIAKEQKKEIRRTLGTL